MSRLLPNHPTFAYLLKHHDLTIPAVARQAQVDILDVSTMYLNHPIKQDIAVGVLQSFNQLYGTEYTLKNTTIHLKKSARDGRE